MKWNSDVEFDIRSEYLGLEEWVKFPIFLQSNVVGPKKEQVGECVTGVALHTPTSKLAGGVY